MTPSTGLARQLHHWARRAPHSLALDAIDRRGRSRSFDWQSLQVEVRKLATWIERNVTDDQPIVFESDNSLEDVLWMIASELRGQVFCPIDHRLDDSEKRSRREWVRGHWIDRRWTITELDGVNAPRPNASPATDGPTNSKAELWLWTSATSGAARAVRLCLTGLAINAAAKLSCVPQSPSDHRLVTLPLCHSYARTCDFGTWLLSGSRLTVRLGSDASLDALRNQRFSHLNTVPSLASRLLSDVPDHLPKVLGCGGAALTADLYNRLRAHNVDVIAGYGLTETSPVIASMTTADATDRTRDRGTPSVGRIAEIWKFRIRNGLLHVGGPCLMRGYVGQPDIATQWRLPSSDPSCEPGFCTGDLVEIDDRGQLRILGRLDDQLKLPNGVMVNPSDLEASAAEQLHLSHAFFTLIDGIAQLWVVPSDAAHPLPKTAQIESCRGVGPIVIRRMPRPPDIHRGELTLKMGWRRQAMREQVMRWSGHTPLEEDPSS